MGRAIKPDVYGGTLEKNKSTSFLFPVKISGWQKITLASRIQDNNSNKWLQPPING